MCGIAGFINFNGEAADREILGRMNCAIRHRGPDEDGFYVRENVGLAMRRLSIIDLAGGQQPIHNEDTTKWIVYNGEIYNYRELREMLNKLGHRFYTNSDTEAIVHLYDEYGADCLEHLRGMFAFAIWDEQDRSLFLARDRVGKKPLLYSHLSNGDLIFGSEFQALLQHPSISREVDYAAIDSYLSYLCVPAPQTAFKQIRKLEPGHWLKWKDGKVQTQRYWLPDFSKKIKISEQEAIEETTRIVREATRVRLVSEVPLGAFLSGGVDSSTVVALMAQESELPVKTFSIGFEEQDFNELKYAKQVAEHLGTDHHEYIVKPNAMEVLPTLVSHFGEPYADSSAIPTYYVARETRRHVTVALNGDGGDENFAGYERYAAIRASVLYNRIPKFLRTPLVEWPLSFLPASEVNRTRTRDLKRFVKTSTLSTGERYVEWTTTFRSRLKEQIYSPDYLSRIADADTAAQSLRWFRYYQDAGPIDSSMFADQLTYLPNDLLVKVDIASMANSLEARSPFLDHKVIEFAARLPEGVKMRGFETKSLLKKVAARLVPSSVIYRTKMGFGIPLAKWLRRDMRDFVLQTLVSEKALRRNIIKPDHLKRLVTEHLDSQSDHTYQIWTLLMLELWFQMFID